MAEQDRSLKDIIKFLDKNGDMTDERVSEITAKLKFSEVLDLISAIKSNDIDGAKSILSSYDEVFSSTADDMNPATEGMNQPSGGSLPTTTATKPMATAPAGQQARPGNEDDDLDTLINDPAKKNSPEVKQIQSLMQRLQQR